MVNGTKVQSSSEFESYREKFKKKFKGYKISSSARVKRRLVKENEEDEEEKEVEEEEEEKKKRKRNSILETKKKEGKVNYTDRKESEAT